jgi:hypothetical protein
MAGIVSSPERMRSKCSSTEMLEGCCAMLPL